MKARWISTAQLRVICGLVFFIRPVCDCLVKAAPVVVEEHASKSRSDKYRSQLPVTREVYAVWYNVPPMSLARRRAKITELTAAHNQLPLGTLVRVTRVSNGRSVIVRITDRGITNKRAKIDICKEAAEELGMLRAGIARVRLELVPEQLQPAAPEPGRVVAH